MTSIGPIENLVIYVQEVIGHEWFAPGFRYKYIVWIYKEHKRFEIIILLDREQSLNERIRN